MYFRRIVLTSLLIGLVGGLFMTLGQQWLVAPIIFASEQYEGGDADPVVADAAADSQAADHPHDGPSLATQDHHHDDEAWAPEDGAERFIYSALSNVLAGIGFSALLLAVMCQLQLFGLTRLSSLKGLLWGLAGFGTFFVAPSLGLPPEIPGIEAAPLENRQAWWVATVLATAVGLGVLAFASKWVKLAGIAVLVVPHVVAAPQIVGPEFAHPDPQVVQVLMSLHADFIMATVVTNGVFWLVTGLMSGWVLNRSILKDAERPA